MESFRKGRVLFAGDAAHQVSPFGARGANSGLQDTDNLCWKLKLIIDGKAPVALLDSYDYERIHGADENILNSSRSTDFITPKSEISRVFRDAVLDLSEHLSFARPLVNSGRLSVPCTYDGSDLNSDDGLDGPARTRPGSPASDAPVEGGWLLDQLDTRFHLVGINADVPSELDVNGIPVRGLSLSTKSAPQLSERYLGDSDAAVYLMRPDQHVAARWPSYSAAAVADAVNRATARG
jgi:3-(3-hydroxy-phenyl)propionate hydroxylase